MTLRQERKETRNLCLSNRAKKTSGIFEGILLISAECAALRNEEDKRPSFESTQLAKRIVVVVRVSMYSRVLCSLPAL